MLTEKYVEGWIIVTKEHAYLRIYDTRREAIASITNQSWDSTWKQCYRRGYRAVHVRIKWEDNL